MGYKARRLERASPANKQKYSFAAMKERVETENRFSTAKTESSRSILTRSSTGKDGKLSSRENHFIRGERVSHSGMTPLDSLYKSSHPRYPTFPSIYESKYAHDFQYVPWPAFICKREYTPPPDYSQFKVGKSSYNEEHNDSAIVEVQSKQASSKNSQCTKLSQCKPMDLVSTRKSDTGGQNINYCRTS